MDEQDEEIMRQEDASNNFDALEEQLIRRCALHMEHVADISPEWAAYFEDVQALSASKPDVLELLRAAPTPFATGLMYGIYLMRQELALITGRDFL